MAKTVQGKAGRWRLQLDSFVAAPAHTHTHTHTRARAPNLVWCVQAWAVKTNFRTASLSLSLSRALSLPPSLSLFLSLCVCVGASLHTFTHTLACIWILKLLHLISNSLTIFFYSAVRTLWKRSTICGEGAFCIFGAGVQASYYE